MKHSVIVCTRNRSASLARALDSLAQASPPRGEWEVVVVDNGSEDDTQAVIARLRGHLPLRSVVEPRPGISHARNAGVAAARGEYLLWTDDDVTVSQGWMRVYEDAYAAHPQAAFFGGPIRPRFVGRPPRWIREQLPFVQSAFAGLDPIPPGIPIDALSRQLPFGANMAVRALEQRQHVFDASLGRQPWNHGLLGGEETDVLKRIVLAGGTGIWLPDSEVLHWIEPERQNLDYLRRFYLGVGYVGARRAIERGRIADERARLRLRRRVAWKRTLYFMGRLSNRTGWWLRSLRRESMLRGRLLAHSEAAAARREAQAEPARATLAKTP